MQRPDKNAPTSEWTKWANEHYPFDGRDVNTARGFDSVRAIDDDVLRGDMARALCEASPEPSHGFRARHWNEPEQDE